MSPATLGVRFDPGCQPAPQLNYNAKGYFQAYFDQSTYQEQNYLQFVDSLSSPLLHNNFKQEDATADFDVSEFEMNELHSDQSRFKAFGMENSPFALQFRDNSMTCPIKPQKLDFNVKSLSTCSRNLFNAVNKENS
jgi:hypothetical protein